MRIAVLGAGGIGGYYGARLAKAGHDVVRVARGAHLEALKRRGVTVRTPDEELTLPITAVPDVRGLEPVDLLLFCVKAYDTEAGARSIAPLVGPDTVVLTVQNGLDRADALATALGEAKAVLAGWRSSMARDLEEGRRLEVDALSGTVVLRGRRAGVPTPVPQAVTACLSLPRPTPAGIPR